MKYDVIVFDFDGTIVDSLKVKEEAFGKIYEPFGEHIVSEVKKYHRENVGISRHVKFKHWHTHLLNLPFDATVARRLSEYFSQLVVNKVVDSEYIPGAYEFLEKYYGQIKFYIASGTPQRELKKIVSTKGLIHFFNGVYGSPATKTEIIQNILRIERVAPGQVLMVGDATSDLKGARDNGTDFLGVDRDGRGEAFDGACHVHNLLDLAKFIN